MIIFTSPALAELYATVNPVMMVPTPLLPSSPDTLFE